MQMIRFNIRGATCDLTLPSGDVYARCARDIMEGRAYPLPANDALTVRSVVDLGAHAGEFTALAAMRWPNAEIHAYEPNPFIIPLLAHNCRAFGNDRIHQQAVDALPRRDKLYFNDIGSVAFTLVRPGPHPPSGCIDWAGVDVDVVGPAQILSHNPDVLKIDIEGVEGRFVEAADLAKVSIIYAEFHNADARRQIEQKLMPTHALAYARLNGVDQGELAFTSKEK